MKNLDGFDENFENSKIIAKLVSDKIEGNVFLADNN